jgi:hypothetical protein
MGCRYNGGFRGRDDRAASASMKPRDPAKEILRGRAPSSSRTPRYGAQNGGVSSVTLRSFAAGVSMFEGADRPRPCSRRSRRPPPLARRAKPEHEFGGRSAARSAEGARTHGCGATLGSSSRRPSRPSLAL